MANLKSLAKDTAIYGLSSIAGRFINYLLVPIQTTAPELLKIRPPTEYVTVEFSLTRQSSTFT